MSKYTDGFEEWSQDTKSYTIKSNRKLTREEISFVVSEADVNYSEEGTTHKIPLYDSLVVLVEYHGNEWGNSDCEITYGGGDLKDG